jgi:transglutaminase-like putative cysteine protease
VFQKLDKRDGARGAASAVETLKAKAGDCTEHTALTVALARAAGIPARAAGGIVLIPGPKSQAGYHAWPELWLGEWVVMDPALGELDTGPRYILLGYDEPGEARGEAKLVRLLGRAAIRMR